jgi:transcriptional regulator with XRE-family HTH domain
MHYMVCNMHLVTGDIYRTWGMNIQSTRELREITRKELATRLGVKIPTVWRWEKGKVGPTDLHKIEIARVLNADVRALFPLVRGI